MDQLDMAPRSKGIPSSINIQASSLGRYYSELLVIGARTTGATPTSYAGGLIKQAIAANEARIKERVEHAAKAWGCDFDTAWGRIVAGEDLMEEG